MCVCEGGKGEGGMVMQKDFFPHFRKLYLSLIEDFCLTSVNSFIFDICVKAIIH